MPRKHSPEIKQQALLLSAGESSSVAAEALGISSRIVRRWRQESASEVQALIQEKLLSAAAIGTEYVEAAQRRAWEAALTVPIQTAKDFQALATGIAIGVDKVRLMAGLDQQNARVIPAVFHLVRQMPDDELESLERRLTDGSSE